MRDRLGEDSVDIRSTAPVFPTHGSPHRPVPRFTRVHLRLELLPRPASRAGARLLLPRGLVRIEVDRGIGAFPPGTPSHHDAIGHLYFETMLQLDTALAATAPELVADQRKYYSGESVVQVSEVVSI